MFIINPFYRLEPSIYRKEEGLEINNIGIMIEEKKPRFERQGELIRKKIAKLVGNGNK